MPRQQRKSRDEGSFSEPCEALEEARHVQRQAAALNFDWPDAHGALRKLREEIAELEALLNLDGTRDPASREAVEEEMGDLLFAAVNVARLCEVSPGSALSGATAKFRRRFRELISEAERQGIDPRGVSLEELDLLWERVKRGEQARN